MQTSLFTDEELNQNEILEENFNDNLGEVVVFKDDEKYKFEKILKSNSIIYGKTNKKSPVKIYAKDLKILNFFYKLLEDAVRQRKEPPKGAVTLQFPMEIYRILVDNQRNWKRVFISSIKRLEEVKFELENYYNPEKQETISYQSTRLLAFPKFYSINKEENKIESEVFVDIKDDYGKDIGISVKGADIFQATFSEEIAVCCWQKTNYTHLSFKIINNLQNKFSIKFYEILVSKLQMSANYMDSNNEITLSKKELAIVFDNSFDPNYNLKHFLANIVNFDDVILPELRQHLEIEKYEVFSTNYSICFYFNKKTLDKFRTKEITPYKLELEKFLNLLESKEYSFRQKNGVIDTSSTLYTFSAEKINEALENFLLVLNKNYCNTELLRTQKEKKKFGGDVIMTPDKGFVYKDKANMKVSKARQEGLLKHLYKNYYVEIMTNIELNKIKQASIENKEEIKSIFSPYIGKMINLGDNKHIAKVENIKTDTDLKLEVIFNMYNKNNLYKPVSTFLKTFENILFFTDYLIKNEYKV